MSMGARHRIPLTVTAKNEERCIDACLESLQVAARRAEAALPVELALCVVLDDCTDGTLARVRARGVEHRLSSGGKVEAQRVGLRPGPFQLFSDADVVVEPDVLVRLCEVMLAKPDVRVAWPRKAPFPPRRRTPLAWALHVYNRRQGFASRQHWFSGKLFAIRDWDIPKPASLQEARRAAGLPPLGDDLFYRLAQGVRADDIYLSRDVLRRFGPDSIRQTDGFLWFRAPETWEGMYRYYRRLRMELERTDLLLPETREVHRRYGSRVADALGSAAAGERAAHLIFRGALSVCRARYRLERWWFQRLASAPCEAWPPVEETKCP